VCNIINYITLGGKLDIARLFDSICVLNLTNDIIHILLLKEIVNFISL